MTDFFKNLFLKFGKIPAEDLGGGLLPDIPDERDYRAENIVGELTEKEEYLPSSFRLPKNKKNTPVQNQGRTLHCTAYGITKVFELMNTDEHNRVIDFDPEEQWRNQRKFPGTANEKVGDYTKSACRALQKFELESLDSVHNSFGITGYAMINKTKESLKKWLFNGYSIYTSCDTTYDVKKKWTTWTYARETGHAEMGLGRRVGGHAFAVVGYDEEGLICENSWGGKWGNFRDGTFKIKWGQIQHLHTLWILHDKKDVEYIFTDVSENSPWVEVVKWAKEKKIVSGYPDGSFRPDQGMTRGEVLSVLKRLFG